MEVSSAVRERQLAQEGQACRYVAGRGTALRDRTYFGINKLVKPKSRLHLDPPRKAIV